MDPRNFSLESCCCDWWSNGCGCDPLFGGIADFFEAINPFMEAGADAIWIFGSPLAFPFIFCFPPGQPTDPPGGGWDVSMLWAPIRLPCHCLFYTVCLPCGQWVLRRKLLDYDMTRYKLWQGFHDGPQCLARRCPGAPITIEAGTYGEQDCPNLFLCAEVWCLGGCFSVCCSFDVNRRMIKLQRNLGDDPTEQRVNSCVGFFSNLAQKCCMIGCCLGICACCVGCCASGSADAQECSGEAGRAANACQRCAMTCWKGIWSVRVIATGCMSAQMDHELKVGTPLLQPPKKISMDRGVDDIEEEDENAWWKRPQP